MLFCLFFIFVSEAGPFQGLIVACLGTEKPVYTPFYYSNRAYTNSDNSGCVVLDNGRQTDVSML